MLSVKLKYLFTIFFFLIPLRAWGETIHPYLLHIDSTSATICWVTNKKIPSTLQLYSLNKVKKYREETPAKFHKLNLTQLTPGTRYRYEIGKVYQGFFTTADLRESFKIAVFGHPGGTKSENQFPIELQAQTIENLSPDFALCTGDITYYANIEGFQQNFFNLFKKFLTTKPIYLSTGNHDCGWPMIFGVDYTIFRKIFPYNYASEEGAYYSFNYKNTKFISFSYISKNKEHLSKQLEWLRTEVSQSQAEFNIVFLGGANEDYYDKQSLFETIQQLKIDLVLGGDGGNIFQQKTKDLHFFFAGTSLTKPHPIYFLEFSKYVFTIKTFDSEGHRLDGFWNFYSKKEKTKLLELQPSFTVRENSTRINFQPINLRSDAFDGLALELNWIDRNSDTLLVHWRPLSIKGNKGPQYFQNQPLEIRANSVNKMLIPLPPINPFTQEPYILENIILEVLNNGTLPELINRNQVSKAYLFKD